MICQGRTEHAMSALHVAAPARQSRSVVRRPMRPDAATTKGTKTIWAAEKADVV